jgi:hypothetical protein
MSTGAEGRGMVGMVEGKLKERYGLIKMKKWAN